MAYDNPVLELDAMKALLDLPRPVRAKLAAVLRDLGKDARVRAEKAWMTNKAPMAAYWKSVGVYARHVARAVEPKPQPDDRYLVERCERGGCWVEVGRYDDVERAVRRAQGLVHTTHMVRVQSRPDGDGDRYILANSIDGVLRRYGEREVV